jgi:cytosine/adenosine deaminase-related metal-dependent hydrolase
VAWADTWPVELLNTKLVSQLHGHLRLNSLFTTSSDHFIISVTESVLRKAIETFSFTQGWAGLGTAKRGVISHYAATMSSALRRAVPHRTACVIQTHVDCTNGFVDSTCGLGFKLYTLYTSTYKLFHVHCCLVVMTCCSKIIGY